MKTQELRDLFSLAGRTAVVTGGGGVLCGAVAEAFLAAGAAVFLLDRDEDKARRRAEELKEGDAARPVFPLAADVLDEKGLGKARDAVLERTGRVDILVNGAGGNHPSATTDPEKGVTFFDIPGEGLEKVFALNFTGTINCCRVFGKVMAERKSGAVINIASMNAFIPLTRVPAYSAAKAAVVNFTRWLAVDMARNHSPALRVNALAPGFFETEQNRFLLYDESGSEPALTARGAAIIAGTPMGRFGKGADLAGAALWLASDAAAFVTGTVVAVDGGFSAFSGV